MKLTAEVKSIAQAKRIRAETSQPNPDLAQAIESASEWNSLLMTARAERGPQWDVGTQQFLVDKYSDLYYDSTPLQEAVKKVTEDETPEEQVNQNQQPTLSNRTPHRDRDFHMSSMHGHMGYGGHESSPHRHHAPPPNYPYPSSPAMNVRGGPGPYPSSGGAPFNPPTQYFGGEAPSTPVRMGSMGNIHMMDHSMGGGHPMGGMGMGGGGMPGMPMHVSPGMGRRVTRGMVEDGYPMH